MKYEKTENQKFNNRTMIEKCRERESERARKSRGTHFFVLFLVVAFSLFANDIITLSINRRDFGDRSKQL